jgi:hypothetical protein
VPPESPECPWPHTWVAHIDSYVFGHGWHIFPQCPSPVSRVEPIDRCVSGHMWWHARYDQHIERIHFTELPMWQKETDVHNFVSRWCQMIVLILGWSTCWKTLVFMSLFKTDVFIIRNFLFWMSKLKYDCLSWGTFQMVMLIRETCWTTMRQ